MWLLRQQPWRLPPQSLLPSSFRSLLPKAPLRYSFSTDTLCRDRPRPPGFVVDYLVSACGLSVAEAMRTAKHLAHVKSTTNADAILRLVREECLLDDAQIRRLVVCRPYVLLADPERTLRPKIRCLLEAGFSGRALARLVASGGIAIPLGDGPGRIQFWRNLLGSNKNLLIAVDRNHRLLGIRLGERVFPILSFLQSVGFSDKQIGLILRRSPNLVSSHLERVKALVEQVKSFGFSPGSAMFLAALCCMANISKSTLEAKMRSLRSFGLSEAEVVLAFHRFHNITNISQKKIKAVLDFLLGEAGCTASYVAARAVLVGLSLEGRLVPRFRVMQSLRMGGLVESDRDLYGVMRLPDEKFMDKYIVPNKGKIPGLLDVYIASGGKNNISR